ncbi:phosphoketolase family protein [Curtobacterium sp. Leaf261]|uniref:phosphoketolase family protein n=1 Tax=Curtobacterium sp. Leaf261 TaxID=1736311 RepID=UPI000701ECEF|nr:phosphoketolase family protein [Curtobacterium sp. Leaf261]KQO61262.1 phosphoketolase [Curtobacterium sp. Leaf261]
MVTRPTSTSERLRAIDAWWRAANYLTVGQIYLLDDPLLRRPLTRDDIKPRLLGHWGTSPALNLVYAHLNALISETDRDVLYICGPGHGGPAMNANAWLEGTWTELYPEITPDVPGLTQFFKQFSFPGGIPSHAAPETPGSINEGGELGYSVAHAYGAALDNPDLVVACVVGDGEAETGPLAASWQAHTFLDPEKDGAVLPILNLNGYKIANPTILARIPEEDLVAYFRGLGYAPIIVDSARVDHEPFAVHALLDGAMRRAFAEIDDIQAAARSGNGGAPERPRWPLIVLRTPKGWTGPKTVDGVQVEGTFRAHQVPLPGVRDDEGHREQLIEWMQSYRPDDLFDEDGLPIGVLRGIRPDGDKRMSATPHANGGRLRTALDRPDLEPYAVEVDDDRSVTASSTGTLGPWLRDLIARNPDNFRLFGPDETVSNKLDAVFEDTNRVWRARTDENDEHLAPRGRVTEILSEHVLEGMLEGYVLSGRHGIINTYEAFAHIIDSMVGQHAKWLESSVDIDWRVPVSNLTILLSSHVWRQDHNGFSHQDPGFIDVVASKQQDLVRIKFPPDANSLLAVATHAMKTTERIEVIVAGKHEEPVFLSLPDAVAHVAAGVGRWDWAGTEVSAGGSDGTGVDVVLACAGDVPTVETVAAADIIRQHAPDVITRVVNVVDILTLGDPRRHEHPIPDEEYDALFLPGTPTVFAFHGYPNLVHQMTYRRHGHDDLHVHGFMEQGTTTSPFDMLMRNDMDRFALAHDALTRVADGSDRFDDLLTTLSEARTAARAFAYEHGEDHASVAGWRFDGWPQDEPSTDDAGESGGHESEG